MGKLIECKSCSQKLAKSAKSCPGCGESNHRTSLGAWIVAGMLAVGMGTCFTALNDSPGAAGASAREPSRVAAPTVEVTARELSRIYNENEVEADNRYRGKIVRVSGVVNAIGKDFMDNPYVELKAKLFANVMCHFDEKQNGSLAHLKSGQRVVLKGRGGGVVLSSPQIKDCVIEAL